MPALSLMHNLPARASRAACALAGILLLLLQMLSPVLASSGEGIWVEICSEAGTVWVQMDLEEEGSEDPTAPCPECADCALCAVSGPAPVPEVAQARHTEIVQFVQCQNGQSFVLYNSVWLWPETRGPPAATQNIIERALRASMAFTQVSGGAPWS